MENPESSTQKTSETYDNDPVWQNTFRNHGIGDRHIGAWFSNYKCVEEWEFKALAQVKANARRNVPIALIGDVGRGKTHLATAILKDAIICGVQHAERKSFERDDGKTYYYHEKIVHPGQYYTMSDLHRKFRESMKDGNESKFMDFLCTCKTLIIDEVQIKSDSDSEQRMFQEVVDKRYANVKQTVFVGNCSVESFRSICGERLADRMSEWGLVMITFKGESYRRKK